MNSNSKSLQKGDSKVCRKWTTKFAEKGQQSLRKRDNKFAEMSQLNFAEMSYARRSKSTAMFGKNVTGLNLFMESQYSLSWYLDLQRNKDIYKKMERKKNCTDSLSLKNTI